MVAGDLAVTRSPRSSAVCPLAASAAASKPVIMITPQRSQRLLNQGAALVLAGSSPVQSEHAERQLRSALVGGAPARQRVLGAQGRKTVRRLLEAGLAELAERGFHAFRVDGVVRRAQTSHGTFYLYFSNRKDFFRALMRDALHDVNILTGDFPVVTDNHAGRAALRDWVRRFADTYAAHAAVIRALSQADNASQVVWGDGLRTLFGLAEAIAAGMTTAVRGYEHGDGQGPLAQHAELTALACVMMLERVNYLISIGVGLPADEMTDRICEVIYAAFHSAQPTSPREPADPIAGAVALQVRHELTEAVGPDRSCPSAPGHT